jgi:hypothetical protein
MYVAIAELHMCFWLAGPQPHAQLVQQQQQQRKQQQNWEQQQQQQQQQGAL